MASLSNNPVVLQPYPAAQLPPNTFKTSLREFCSEPSECAYACFCYPCFRYQVYQSAGEGFAPCCFSNVAQLRTKVRSLKGIQGSIFGDACAGYCLPCCTLIQVNNELSYP